MLLKVDCLPNAVGKQLSIPLINNNNNNTLICKRQCSINQ